MTALLNSELRSIHPQLSIYLQQHQHQQRREKLACLVCSVEICASPVPQPTHQILYSGGHKQPRPLYRILEILGQKYMDLSGLWQYFIACCSKYLTIPRALSFASNSAIFLNINNVRATKVNDNFIARTVAKKIKI